MFGAVLLLVLVTAAALRLHDIARRSYWFDEGVTLGMARLSLGDLLGNAGNISVSNQTFYYVAMHLWRVFGESELVVRGFSAVCSVASIGLVCALGRRFFGSAAAIAAGVLLSAHWLSIRIAQEARAYAFVTMLVCLAAFLLQRYVEHGRRRDLAGWTLASAAAMHAHYFALFPIAAQIVSLAALGPQALRERRGLVAGIAGIVLAVAPIVVLFANASPSLIAWIPPITADRLFGLCTSLAGGTGSLPYVYGIVLAVLTVRMIREEDAMVRWGSALTICWAIGPLLVMAAISMHVRILLDRYVAMSIPAWPLAAGAAAGLYWSRGWRGLPVLALLAAVLVSELDVIDSVYQDKFEDWRAPAAMIASRMQPGDRILYESPWSGLTLEYYLGGASPDRLQRGPLLFTGEFDRSEASAAERVWLVLSRANHDLEIRLQGLLQKTHPHEESSFFDNVQVLLYAR